VKTRTGVILSTIVGVPLLFLMLYLSITPTRSDSQSTVGDESFGVKGNPNVVIMPPENRERLNNVTIANSIKAAKSDQIAQEFLVKFHAEKITTWISYHDKTEVQNIKFTKSEDGSVIQRAGFAFLNESSPTIGVRFFVDNTPLEEHPGVTVYIDPSTFEALGAMKEFW